MFAIPRNLLALPLVAALALPATAAEVNVYSYRQEHLIRPLLDAYTGETGIAVNLVSGEADALLERLKSEGMNSPADLLLTTDAGRLIRAKEAGVLQPVRSPALEGAIPPQYRDPEGYWFGLSVRSRVIFYARDRVKPDAIASYEALADAKWKGRICIRSSSNVYNQSLVAALIAAHGTTDTEKWAQGLVANLARPPQGGDRDQIKAVAAGECDIAVGNSYYYGRMLNSDKEAEKAAAAKVGLIWPNQGGRGAHVNISGGGVTRSARNKENAIKLLEFLVSDGAQKLYAEGVFEYPVKPGVAVSTTVKGFGPFKADTLPLAELAKHNTAAVRLTDRVGWR